MNVASSQVEPATPTVLPTTRPRTTPRATGSLQRPLKAVEPPMVTPEAKNAKTGTANPAESGPDRCSSRSASPCASVRPSRRRTGTVNASSTPATVACTPEACTSVHATAASGQEDVRRAAPGAGPGPRRRAIGSTASARYVEVEVLGVEHRDHRDREQVVDHRQGEQERAQRDRQVGAEHGEDRQGEGDVGGRGDRPAAQRPAAAGRERDVDQRGHDHAADRGGHRQRRPARVAQVAGHELALQLQTGDEEEDGQQPVGRPGAEAQVEVQRLRPDDEVAQVVVGRRPRAVGPHQRRPRPRR